MPNGSRLSGARAIGSHETPFRKARIKLTLIYASILAFILLLSSAIILSAFSRQLNVRFPQRHQMMVQAGLVPGPEDVRADLILTLFIVNGMLLVGASVLSYWLADMTLQPIQEAYVRQKEFLGDVSHELRTPLAILQLGLENESDKEGLGGEAIERIESQKEEVARMSSLVDDLLKLNRFDASNETVAFEPVEVHALIEKCMQRLKSLADRQEVSLNLSANGIGLIASADREMLGLAVSNVIKNAVLYNKPGGKVDVAINKSAGKISIAVADDGIGISKEDQEKIFRRFYRVDKSRSRSNGGSGLGLAIVESIVTKLGGTIDIRSELGKGTTVIMALNEYSAS